MDEQKKLGKPYVPSLVNDLDDEAIAVALMQTPAERIRLAVAMTLKEYGVTEEELKARRKKPQHIIILSYYCSDHT